MGFNGLPGDSDADKCLKNIGLSRCLYVTWRKKMEFTRINGRCIERCGREVLTSCQWEGQVVQSLGQADVGLGCTFVLELSLDPMLS